MSTKTNTYPLSDRLLLPVLDLLDRADEFVFFETTKVTPEERRSFLFLNPVDRLVCTTADSPVEFFQRAEEWLSKGFFLAGSFAYEFGYKMEPVLSGLQRTGPEKVVAELGVFREPHIFDHISGSFSGAGPWPSADISFPAGKDAAYAIGNLRLNQRREDYFERIARIKAYIESGDTYQVNYTLKLLFDFSGSPSALYTELRRNQSVSYGAYISLGGQRIMSFSPELFFSKKGNSCTVRPMKGTIRRGRTVVEDESFASFLRQDIKNRSENVMIVDLLRNDLGRLCTMGTVAAQSLFDVETYETLHQMTSTITGELRPDIGLADFFHALFPSGSVTGAPKIRTMEIIRELELEDRGVYTGGIGYIDPAGNAVFNVPIRTVILEDGKGEMGVGSGIVYDSDPEGEWEECRLKGRFLSNPAREFQLIETMLWEPETGYWLLDFHLDRLIGSAGYFAYPVDRAIVSRALDRKAVDFSNAVPHRVRLVLSKDGELEITAVPCPAPVKELLPEIGAKAGLPLVALSKKATDSGSPYLFHKTTIRDLYESERQKAVAAGLYEALFCNERGEITEGSITNIFVRTGDCFRTPPVECGLLAGVFRKYFLDACPVEVREEVLTVKDLAEADAIYVANSVRGLVRVRLE